ncbi:MAG: hypothetical protein JWL92_131 [Candidatus Nomurabacteria bacterium]|nr:hypothetical protein [Candidatus Nomurabacteria bacterium]
MNNDDITNNAEYETEDVLNEIEGKDGEALDPIERNQVTPGNGDAEISEDENAKDALATGIAGNDDNAQDKPLDEENY